MGEIANRLYNFKLGLRAKEIAGILPGTERDERINIAVEAIAEEMGVGVNVVRTDLVEKIRSFGHTQLPKIVVPTKRPKEWGPKPELER